MPRRAAIPAARFLGSPGTIEGGLSGRRNADTAPVGSALPGNVDVTAKLDVLKELVELVELDTSV